MTEKEINKALRRRFSASGWTLLIYYGILNVMVIVAVAVELCRKVLRAMQAGISPNHFWELVAEAAGSGWGYLAAGAVGLVILLGWKGAGYLGREIWTPGKKMTAPAFWTLLCVFCGTQMVFSLLTGLLDWLLSPMGVDIGASVEAATAEQTGLSMLLYGSLAAPITEEILFRGLLRENFRFYGKRFGIFASAFLFGAFHGNLVQSPFAFAAGLVLGYTAETYGLGWSVLLHIFNNFVLGVVLPGAAALLPGTAGDLLQSGVFLLSFLGTLVILLVRREELRAYYRNDRMDGRCLRCFFTNFGVILLLILCLSNMVMMLMT